MHWNFTEIKESENENLFFFIHFLNMDISAPIADNPSKFKRYLHETLMEGSVSQIVDIGPS